MGLGNCDMALRLASEHCKKPCLTSVTFVQGTALAPAGQRGHNRDVHTQPSLRVAVSCHMPILCFSSFSLGLLATKMAVRQPRAQKRGPLPLELGSLGCDTLTQRRLGPGCHKAGERTAGDRWGAPSHVRHFTGVIPCHQSLD